MCAVQLQLSDLRGFGFFLHRLQPHLQQSAQQHRRHLQLSDGTVLRYFGVGGVRGLRLHLSELRDHRRHLHQLSQHHFQEHQRNHLSLFERVLLPHRAGHLPDLFLQVRDLRECSYYLHAMFFC